MTEIMPVPRNLNITVLPAGAFAALFILKGMINVPAGRPKGSKTKPRQKTCTACEDVDKATKNIDEFYISTSPLHQDGRVPYCKECIQRLSYNEKRQTIDVEAFKKILMQIDKPYIESALQMAIDQYNETYSGVPTSPDNRKKIIGFYFQKIHSLKQYAPVKSWEDGIEYAKKEKMKNNGQSVLKVEEGYPVEDDESFVDKPIYSVEGLKDFEVTRDMIRFWGSGYRKSEYKAMQEKYDFLKENYPDPTNLHTEALKTYVRFKVKEEFAVAHDDVIAADKWGQAATKAAEKAKINPNQLSKSDLQGGLNSFSELFMAVEQSVDVIPILPQFKFRPNDAIDFNIWCFINYLRDLEGKPQCKYEDVYKFYDERKAEYISQYGDPYGIFTGDPTEGNREAIKRFITLPKNYEGDD